MARRYVVVLVIVVLVLLTLTGLWVLTRPTTPTDQSPAGITLDGYRRIKLGMTQKEVEHIMGKPPGIYDAEKMGMGHPTWGGEEEGDKKDGTAKSWITWNAHIEVAFDRNGKAIYKGYQPLVP